MVKSANTRSKKTTQNPLVSQKKGAKASTINNGNSEPEITPGDNSPSTSKTIDENVRSSTELKPTMEKVNGQVPDANEADLKNAPVTNSSSKSQKKKAATTVNEEQDKMDVDEKGDKKSSDPVSKTIERPKRGQIKPMEVEKNDTKELPKATEPQKPSSEKPSSSRGRKRKADQELVKESSQSAAESEENSPKRKSAERNDERAVEGSVPETKTSTVKSQKRKVETVPSKSKSKKSAKASTTKSAVRTKTKQQKVELSIPPPCTISGKVFVIGENDVGQLGFDDEISVKKKPALLEMPHPISDVAAGGMHSVCLTQNGEVITFGCNDEGALGRVTSDETEERTPQKVQIPEKIIQISAGDSHTAALAESGQVYLWGNFRSGDGAIGLIPDGSKQVKPIKILSGKKIIKISSGTEHLVCLSSEGVVYTCGCGQNGQLGRVPERSALAGGRKGLAALLEPDVVAVRAAKSRSVPVFVEDIWSGAYNTFLKATETGKIYAFGLNNYHHLGFDHQDSEYFPVEVESFNSQTWSQISGGQHHTVALDTNGIVHSLGCDNYGRLGLGEGSGEKSAPTVVPALEKNKCTNISCGNCVSFALTEEGSVYSWGMGTNHQLGHGNDDDCFVPRLIAGDFQNSWRAYKVSGGGQHTLLLASPRESTKSGK